MKYIYENLTLTTFTNILNDKYKKKSGSLFTTGDTQGYIKRGKLPIYLGGNEIIENSKIKGVKLYNIKK